MSKSLTLYNTLSRKKEQFEPLNPPFVGMYVCGPTVYGDPHLGHTRPTITFDLLFRMLKYMDYKVRYVRNITDVGHLVDDADSGEDKIAKQARLQKIEPMEVAQYYTNRYRRFMAGFNVLDPSIEPLASGHIIEQIALTQQILDNGYAYVSNGSVYFDVEKYSRDYHYGKLSGRNLEETMSGGRSDEYAGEKRSSVDFALWKKAEPEHIMRWPSPWSDGFPGWHAECSAMSAKYLGNEFDIHGGGMDLVFPHHECEIAQSTAAHGHGSARYWVHNNMVTVNGQKMGKSLGNFITLEQFFTGDHPLLSKPYSPMTIRFFILQAHYRSPLDFSDGALQAAEKGLERLYRAWELIKNIKPSASSTLKESPEILKEKCMDAMLDDLNSPIAIAYLFDWVRVINSLHDGSEQASKEELEQLKGVFDDVMGKILGLNPVDELAQSDNKMDDVMQLILDIRSKAKMDKNWETSDFIRNKLTEAGIKIMDRKDGTSEWDFI